MVDKTTYKLIKAAMVKSFEQGDIRLSTKNNDGSFTELKHEDSICYNCKKNIGNVLNAFSYFIIQSKDIIGIEEKCFCMQW